MVVNSRKMVMRCAERDKLIQLPIESVQADGNAVRATIDREGKAND
jgi:hypothetical protein